jgi:hypothetical protein
MRQRKMAKTVPGAAPPIRRKLRKLAGVWLKCGAIATLDAPMMEWKAATNMNSPLLLRSVDLKKKPACCGLRFNVLPML